MKGDGVTMDKKKILFPSSTVMGALGIAMGGVVLAKVLSDIFGTMNINLDKYYIADLKYHWKEMAEAILAEKLVDDT